MTQIEQLKAPFPDEELGAVVLSSSRGWVTVKATLGWEKIQERLDEVCPEWVTEIRSLSPVMLPVKFDRGDDGPKEEPGFQAIVRITIETEDGTIYREGVGTDRDARAAVTYALKYAASQLGVGRFLSLDDHYLAKANITDNSTVNQLKYGRLSWTEALPLMNRKPAKGKPKPFPKKEEDPATNGGDTNGAKPWHSGLRKALEAKGISEEEALKLGRAKEITIAPEIEQMTLNETNALLKALKDYEPEEG